MQRRVGQAERTLHASGQRVAASERGVDAWGTVEQSRLEFAEQEVARLSCTRSATEAALPPLCSLEAAHRLAAAPGLDVAPTSTCNYLGERGLQGTGEYYVQTEEQRINCLRKGNILWPRHGHRAVLLIRNKISEPSYKVIGKVPGPKYQKGPYV